MISIVIPAYNNPLQVKKLLDSIRPQLASDPALEVIVVDDCSEGDAVRQTVEGSGFAKYMRLEKNSGPATARNAGARRSRGEIILFLDSDVVMNKDTIAMVRGKFEEDVSMVALGGEYDHEPENKSFATKFKALMARSWVPEGDRVTVFVTRIGAIRKKVFEELGGFDDSIRTASCEEWELGRKMTLAGYAIHYDPAITVKHHFPSFRRQIGLFFHRAFMWVYVFRKYGKFDNTCTTPLSGVAQICGLLSVVFLPCAAINIKFAYVALFFLILFVTGNRRFFKLTLKHEGPVFAFLSLPPALVIACSISLGGISGMFYYFLYKGMLSKNGRSVARERGGPA